MDSGCEQGHDGECGKCSECSYCHRWFPKGTLVEDNCSDCNREIRLLFGGEQ